MGEENEVRVDKWLWAVRIFKTRSLATEACRKGKVLILDQAVKPSRLLRPGDIIRVRKLPVIYTYRVLGLSGKRLSAGAAQELVENLTPESEMDKLRVKDSFFIVRDKGSGRPTKKDRRTIDKIRGK